MTRLYIETAGWIAFVTLLWIYAEQYDRPIFGTEISIVAWPRAVLILVLVAVVFHFFEERNRLRNDHLARKEAWGGAGVFLPEGIAVKVKNSVGNNFEWLTRISLTALISFLYIFLLPKLGFFIMTPFFVIAFMLVFKERRWQHLFITSLVFVGLVAVLFTRFLYVPLPTGNISPFYELNVEIVEAIRK